MRKAPGFFLAAALLAACTSKREFTEEDAAGGAAGENTAVAGESNGSGGSADGSGGAPPISASCGDEEYDDGESCVPLTTCGAGSFVSGEPTATSDRVCSDCAPGTFSRVVNAPECAAWSVCGGETSESVPPSATSDRICSKCGAGKFEASGECQALTVCQEGQYESTAPTATSDRACSDVTSCEPGSKQTSAPTSTTDRQCAACGAGTFSTEVNATTCKLWTVCAENQKQSAAGTPTSDVTCVDKPVCSTAADRACSVDCPCESSEGVCTSDDQCVSGASCVEGSGIKVGRTGKTCLAAHCNNNVKDGTETSVDCGGECGCRATYEVVPLKGLPADTGWAAYHSLSRDGKVIVGELGRGRSPFPGVIAVDGTVTELPAHGRSGAIYSATADGSVLIGGMSCANPPSCTDTTWSAAKWTGGAAPTLVRAGYTVRAASSSGTVLAGDFYDAAASQQRGFVINGNSTVTIADLGWVVGLTPDGKHVAGSLQSGVQGGLVEVQTKTLTKIGSTSWSSTTLADVNGTTPVVIGWGYVSSTDSYIGFRWRSGTLTQLGLLAGGKYTHPAAVSLDGSTVVGLTGTNELQHAFIWTDQDKLRTIVDELVSRGLELPVDMRLTQAMFISDDGKTIIGREYTGEPAFWRVTLQ